MLLAVGLVAAVVAAVLSASAAAVELVVAAAVALQLVVAEPVGELAAAWPVRSFEAKAVVVGTNAADERAEGHHEWPGCLAFLRTVDDSSDDLVCPHSVVAAEITPAAAAAAAGSGVAACAAAAAARRKVEDCFALQ